MPKSNVEKIRFAATEILEKGNLQAISEIFTANYTAHMTDSDYSGLLIIRDYIMLLHSAIYDIKVLEITPLLQTADAITWQRTLSGKHKDHMMDIAPSGKNVQWSEMVVTRFNGEKIAEEWIVSEMVGELLSKLPKKYGFTF